MTEYLLAEFSTAGAATAAAHKAFKAGHPPQDVLSPIPLGAVGESLARSTSSRSPIGWVMFVAAAVGAATGWLMQWYSAVFDYPINSGGRPLDSWPAFLLVPYETAILSAGIVGLLGWMWMCGLPKLFHPLFAADAAERAVQDRFLLVFPLEKALAHWVEIHLKPNALHEIRE